MVRNLEISDTGAGQALTGANAERTNDKRFNCVATECMMWRWVNEFQKFGFCGLAGTPV